jgi:hypothetical protein
MYAYVFTLTVEGANNVFIVLWFRVLEWNKIL